MEKSMRIKMGVWVVISVGALSQAFATEPPAEAANSSSSSANTPATAKAIGTASKTDTKAAPSTQSKPVNLVAGDADAEARLRRLRAAGYRPEMRNKQVVFCRSEQALG